MTRQRAESQIGAVTFGDLEVPYRVVRSARARYVRLRIGFEREVQIVVPRGHRLGDVGSLLRPHQRWIARGFERAAQLRPETAPLAEGTPLLFAGAVYLLAVEARGSARPRVERIDGQIILVTPEEFPADSRKGVLQRWYRDQARTIVGDCVGEWSARMDVAHGRIAIRDQRSRWGSCSSKGNLNFSWRLIMAPPPALDYVVVHELAHLIHPDHSSEFWQTVESYCPDRHIQESWLRENGASLWSVLP